MGKRHVVVLTSSEDEDRDCSRKAICNSSKSKLRTTGSRKKSRSAKKASNLDFHVHEELLNKEEINFDRLADDFYDGRREFDLEAGSGWRDSKELWVDKHKPHSVEELAVHKKKVEEVKLWLEQRVRSSKDGSQSCALVITGPAGAGKSAAIHVIASLLGAEAYEWKTPTPTLWQEHIHNSVSGISYISKLDEFEIFVERIRKYPLLPSVSTGESKKPVILLIDDLPTTNGGVANGRLTKCLQCLVQSTQIPTVILFTEHGRTNPSDDKTRNLEELPSVLERAGAYKVAFNPLTTNSVKKTLSRICREERCNVTAECIEQISKASGGDIRHAITSLQYYCLRADPVRSSILSDPAMTCSEGKVNGDYTLPFSSACCTQSLEENFLLPFGKDETLSLFHALGKFLHNKRETVLSSDFGQESFLLKEKFARLPLKMDAPEKVLSQAHGQGGRVADFLHENVLDFLSDEAIDDAWTVANYLSDSDHLLAGTFCGSAPSRVIRGRNEPESVAQLVGTSVAVRGVLFGNAHPSPSRWHSIRSPKLWQVELSLRHNKNQLVQEKFKDYSSFTSSSMSIMATEFRPAVKWLGYRASERGQTLKKVTEISREEDSDWMICDASDDSSMEGEEDEIEDW